MNSTTPGISAWRTWLAVTTLGIGSFAIVTAELAPIGLLSNIAHDLGESESRIGLIVTLYAWIAAVAALVSATTLSHLPRRPLITVLMVVLALSGGSAALSYTFPTLMVARIVGALAHGAFWAMIGTLGAQIAPTRHIGLATSIIFGGVSIASVLGVPLTNTIGQMEGWRTAFAYIGVLSLGVAGAIVLTLPPVPGTPDVDRAALGRILANPKFRRLYAATACSITAHFMAFTYVVPFLHSILGGPGRQIALLLFAFGVAGLVGNILTGLLIDRFLKPLLVITLAFASLALAVLAALALFSVSNDLLIVAILVMVWGASIAAIFVAFQTWILKEAGTAALPASAIYVSIFNGAIGLGAFLGSIVLTFSGLAQLITIAAIATGGSILAIAFLNAPLKSENFAKQT